MVVDGSQALDLHVNHAFDSGCRDVIVQVRPQIQSCGTSPSSLITLLDSHRRVRDGHERSSRCAEVKYADGKKNKENDR